MAIQVPAYPNALRYLIEHAGYSFREVHQETGIPKSTLFDLAAGNRPIPHREREVLARLFCCSPSELAPLSISQQQKFHDSVVDPSIFADQGVTDRIDDAESIINLAWEA